MTVEEEELNPIEVDPEFDDIARSLEEVSDALDELNDIGDLIENEGAISRTVAVTLEAMDPELLPEGYSIQSYTESPSRTNLTPTVESIARRALDLLKKFIEMVKKAWRTFTDFIKKTWDRLTKRKKQKEKIIEKTEDLKRQTEELKKSAPRDVLRTVDEIEKSAVAEAEKNYRKVFNALTADIVERKSVSRDKLNQLYDSLAPFIKFGELQIDAIEAAYKKLPRRSSDLHENEGLLKYQILDSLRQARKLEGARPHSYRTIDDLLEFSEIVYDHFKTLKGSSFKGRIVTATVEAWQDKRHDMYKDTLVAGERDIIVKHISGIQDRLNKLKGNINSLDDRELVVAFNESFRYLETLIRVASRFTSVFNALTEEEIKVHLFCRYYEELIFDDIKKGVEEETKKAKQ